MNIYLKITKITKKERIYRESSIKSNHNYVCIVELTRWIYFLKQSNFISL